MIPSFGERIPTQFASISHNISYIAVIKSLSIEFEHVRHDQTNANTFLNYIFQNYTFFNLTYGYGWWTIGLKLAHLW